jgi:hypothetical protein
MLGCATNRDLAASNTHKLSLGLTRAELTERFGHPGTPQFRATQDGQRYTCTAYEFENTWYYYFLFQDDVLTAILDAGDFRRVELVPHRDGWLEVEALWDMEEKVAAVLRQDGLSIEEFTQAVIAAGSKPRGGNSYNVLPVFILLSPVMVPSGIVQGAVRAGEEMAWAQRYDPEKIPLGACRSDVLTAYGEPLFRKVGQDHETLLFGPKAELQQLDDGSYYIPSREFWVAVVLADGQVTRVLTDRFFNPRDLLRPEHRVETG